MKKLIKKIFWNLKGGYQPKKFWEGWADEFITDKWQHSIQPQHTWMLSKIKKNPDAKIVEIGCGFGRNIKFLIENGVDAEKITGIDISKKMISYASTYINNKKVTLIVGDIISLPFHQNSFDISLIHGVFMHVPPQQIDKAIENVFSITKQFIINVEQNYPTDNGYTFIHDYKSLYTKLGGKIVEYKKDSKLGLSYYYVEVR